MNILASVLASLCISLLCWYYLMHFIERKIFTFLDETYKATERHLKEVTKIVKRNCS